jgi:hypothetical protein
MDGQQIPPRTGRLARFARGRGFDRNPLRRASDRAESVLLLALLVAFSFGAPLVASAAGGLVHGIAQRNMIAQRASRYPVTATVTGAVSPASPENPAESAARWTAPDGHPVTGDLAAAMAPDGTWVAIWVTRAGQVTTAPLLPSQVAEQSDLAQLLAVAGCAIALAGVGGLARRALDQRRMAAWDAEWLAYGPRGTPRA